MAYAQTSIEREMLERRRSLLRDTLKERCELARLLEERGDLEGLEKLRRDTWDIEVDLVEVESELARLKD